ncbi:hypothetical protein [Laceyella sacchari]
MVEVNKVWRAKGWMIDEKNAKDAVGPQQNEENGGALGKYSNQALHPGKPKVQQESSV